jgi:predicted transcriptional regulator
VDLALLIRQRLEELGLEQQELAQAAQVTGSYISQPLTQKKLSPASNRTDISITPWMWPYPPPKTWKS